MPDLPDYSQSVSVDAASVTLTVSGEVSISSGSVTIANASIAVINAAGTKITSARPPRRAIFVADSPNPNTQNLVLDPDVQAIVFELPQPLSQYVHVKVAWHPVSGGALSWVPLELFQFTQSVYVVPITPDTFDTQGNVTNSLDITIQGTSLGGQAVVGHYLYESAPIWLELFPQPQLEPNQFPLFKSSGALATATADWLITPAANIQITLFEIIEAWLQVATATALSWFIGHGTALPVAVPAAGVTICSDSSPTQNRQAPNTFEFHGAQLPRGDGLWVWNNSLNTIQYGFTVNYSLS